MSIDEDKLYAEMSKLPDFDRFPLPKHWYKKYNIAPSNPIATTQEITEENYAMKMAYAPKDLPPIRHTPATHFPEIKPLPEPIVETIIRPVVNTEQELSKEQVSQSVEMELQTHD